MLSGSLSTPSAKQAFVEPGSFESIASSTISSSGSTSYVEFTSIPATYTHLQLRIFAQIGGVDNSAYYLNVNADTTNTNYYYINLLGDGSAAYGQASAQRTFGSVAGSAWSATIVDILDYTNTNKYKVTKTFSARENNSSGAVFFGGLLWKNTNAITSLRILDTGGQTFDQHSVFALYGIAGA